MGREQASELKVSEMYGSRTRQTRPASLSHTALKAAGDTGPLTLPLGSIAGIERGSTGIQECADHLGEGHGVGGLEGVLAREAGDQELRQPAPEPGDLAAKGHG